MAKILHFGKFYPPYNGGMEIFLRDLAEKQAQTHQVTVLAHNHDFKTMCSATKTEQINGVNVIRQKTLKPILFTPIMLRTNKTVKALIAQDLVDIIHISWPNPSALFLLFNKKAQSLPWVIQWQSDMVTENSSKLLKFAYFFFKPFEKKLLNRAKKIIVSTREYFKHSNALTAFETKCEFIPLGIKPIDTTVDNASLKWAQQQWRNQHYKIYTIGRLTFYKNHQLLIKAAKLLPTAQFIITGTGDLYHELNHLIKQNKLKNITLTGSLDLAQLKAIMSSCDAFCLPSNDRAESYGMVLLEAMCFKKNLLVSNLSGSGMKWIASQSQHGHTFDCNDADDLVKKIKNLDFNTPIDEIDAIFTIQQCANSIDKLYQPLLATGNQAQ